MKRIHTIFILLLTITASAQTGKISFEVIFNSNRIGTLTASQAITGNKETIDIKTSTDAKVLVMAVHVESEINLQKDKSVMKQGIVYRHSNRGSENVAGYTQKQGNRYITNINHKIDTIHRAAISFCVADLYFREPKGVSEVYSNMYGSFVKISGNGNHSYTFTMPDGKVNRYTYVNGKLVEMEVELPVGKVLSRRVEE